jgi:hypothetical protein
MRFLAGFAVFFSFCIVVQTAKANLEFMAGETDDGLRYIVVTGRFDFNDDLLPFQQLVERKSTQVVSFQSPGGSAFKAMELGRLIRKLGLTTLQPRELDCASACALAFMGGVERAASPGALGFHQSSFSDEADFDVSTAVSMIQRAMADVVVYMQEMGIDPSLLQIALKTRPDDMSYLSGEEMSRYGVTTHSKARGMPQQRVARAAPHEPRLPSAGATSPLGFADQSRLPEARTGEIRHAEGFVLLRHAPSASAAAIARLPNNYRIDILGSSDRWYRVKTEFGVGHLHHTWVRVDQFDATPGLQRLIQIKSFSNAPDAFEFARSFPLPVSVFLATNGWYAVTLVDAVDLAAAIERTRRLKRIGSIPDDSFVTLGNTYARRVCCNN